MTSESIRIRARSLVGAVAVLGLIAFLLLGCARAFAIPPSIIIGLNDGSGWGSPDSAKFHERGFTSERIEAGGPFTKIKESSELGWKNDMVIVGNTNDETPLASINVAEWTKETVAQIKEQMTYGVTLFEVGNEVFLKGYCGEGCYQQKEPAKYAEMFVALSKALETEKITGAKLLFDSYGDYETSNGGPWSQVCCGGGWLATAAKAQPELLKRVSGFTMHPYGEAGGNQENDWGPGALKVEHEQAVSLGFEHTDYYATEFGVKLNEGGTSGSSSLANQAERITAVYSELIGFGYVKGIWYYQSHDDGSGKWGLIEPQAGGESPFEPRPALEAVANFALTYEGPNTEAATSLTSSGAKLNGSVNPEGSETHYHFEYGTSKTYGTSVPSVEASIGSGTAGVEVSQAISGLSPSTTYHYRLVAKRGSWTVNGLDHTFTTSSSAPVNTVPPAISPTSPIVGVAESSTTGTWTNSPTSYSYQWKRCNAAGAECTSISGATASTYTPVEADVEHALLVTVTATNAGGSTPASSTATSVVKPAGWLTMAPVYASSFGSSGSGSGQFNHPGNVVVDPKGNLWVLDRENNRVEEFNEKGEYLKAFGTVGSGSGQLKRPCSLALDSKGDVWVADTENTRIEEFNEKGEYLKAFGTAGSEPGQIGEPEGVAVNSHGNVWVSDTYHGRVEVFNEKGEYLKTVGSKGTGAGQIGEPQDLAIDAKGNVWIANWVNSRVNVFNEKGEYVREFGSEGSGVGQLVHPYGIAIDPAGNVWVADTGNNRIDVFGEKGEYETRFGTAGSGTAQFLFSFPVGVTVDGKGDVWVTDTSNSRVQKWVAPSYPPSYLGAFGSAGSGSGQFNHPGNVVLDPKGNLWAIDRGNNRIEEFNEKGEYLKAFGTVGSGAGQLTRPSSLALDEFGDLWVADTGNSRVEEFNEKGEYLKAFGTPGSEPGQLGETEGIAIDSHRNVWVADTYHGRVEEFNEKGEYLKTVGSKGTGAGQIGEPQDLAIDAKGDLWVADWPNSRIEEFNEKGEYVREFASEGSGNGQLSHPYGIAVNAGGNVWVADNGNDRVEVFSEKGEYETKFGSVGSGAGQFSFSFPIGLALDGKGDVWVTDPGNSRIQEWVR